MTTTKHITFLRENKDLLVGPVLIIGSKRYDYDQADPRELLHELGVEPVTGLDLEPGEGVDVVADVCAMPPEFLEQHRHAYNTVLCMEVLTHLDNPFVAGEALDPLIAPGGAVFLSECVVRKLSRMPADNWRFTYTGLQRLFPGYGFHDDRARMSIVRAAGADVLPLSDQLPQVMHERHADETAAGHFLRRVHRKVFARGVFEVSRLLPETAIMAVATKAESPSTG